MDSGKIYGSDMNEKILVVDDELDILEMLSAFLTHEGFQVKTAPSGHAAIEIFNSEPFDLVISDMRMPGMDGLTVMRRLKEIDEDIEVIILTAFAALDNVIEAFRHKGAFDYLTKPLDNINELFVTVTQALDSRRLKIENKALVKQLQQAKTDLEKRVEEQIRTEQQIRKSKMLLQSVFDGISDPLIMLDESATIMMLNKAAVHYYETDFQKAVGNTCREILSKNPVCCDVCNIPSLVKKGEPVSFERKGIMNPSRLEQVVIYPLHEEQNIMPSAIIRISDITEAKLMERQLMQSEKLASLGLLVSGIAHEINNPNNFIAFNIPILRDYLSGMTLVTDAYAENHPGYELSGMSYMEFREDLYKLVDNLEHGSKRINATVSTLKEFSRRKDGLEKQLVNLKTVIEKGVAICQSQIKKLVQEFDVKIPQNLPDIYSDPDVIEQVIINLLINAAQATDKEDSWVKLNVSASNNGNEQLIIEISDNGIGMDDTTIEKIFDPFFTTKDLGEGTGLGLYICHSRVEAMGGRIEVESEKGVGSTFKVLLTDEKENAQNWQLKGGN